MSEQGQTQGSTLSKVGKLVVGIASGIAAVWGAAKSLADVVGKLNGWHVLFILSIVVLLILGIDFCRQWVERKDTGVKTELQSSLTEIKANLQNATQKLETNILQERNSRRDDHISAIGFLKNLESRVLKLEEKIKTS